MSLHHLLTQVARVEVASVSASAQGEDVESWSVHNASANCLLRLAVRPEDVPVAFEQDVTHVLYLEYDSTLLDGRRYRFLIATGGVERTYMASSIEDPANRRHHLQALVRRID